MARNLVGRLRSQRVDMSVHRRDSVSRSIVHQVLPRIALATVASAKPDREPRGSTSYISRAATSSRGAIRQVQESTRVFSAGDRDRLLPTRSLIPAWRYLRAAGEFGFSLSRSNFRTASGMRACTGARQYVGGSARLAGFIALFHDWDWPTAARDSTQR